MVWSIQRCWQSAGLLGWVVPFGHHEFIEDNVSSFLFFSRVIQLCRCRCGQIRQRRSFSCFLFAHEWDAEESQGVQNTSRQYIYKSILGSNRKKDGSIYRWDHIGRK